MIEPPPIALPHSTPFTFPLSFAGTLSLSLSLKLVFWLKEVVVWSGGAVFSSDSVLSGPVGRRTVGALEWFLKWWGEERWGGGLVGRWWLGGGGWALCRCSTQVVMAVRALETTRIRLQVHSLWRCFFPLLLFIWEEKDLSSRRNLFLSGFLDLLWNLPWELLDGKKLLVIWLFFFFNCKFFLFYVCLR